LRGPEDKLVLLLLANEADPGGLVSFGGSSETARRLAEDACMGVEAFQEVVDDLRRRGVARNAFAWGDYLRLSLGREFVRESVSSPP
jgi:hypothetical protein